MHLPSVCMLHSRTYNIYAYTVQQLPLIEGWSAYVDSASGNTYYCNALGASTWERPTLLALTFGNNTSSGTAGAAVTSTALVPSVGYDMAGYVSTVYCV
jgi:WW domain